MLKDYDHDPTCCCKCCDDLKEKHWKYNRIGLWYQIQGLIYLLNGIQMMLFPHVIVGLFTDASKLNGADYIIAQTSGVFATAIGVMFIDAGYPVAVAKFVLRKLTCDKIKNIPDKSVGKNQFISFGYPVAAFSVTRRIVFVLVFFGIASIIFGNRNPVSRIVLRTTMVLDPTLACITWYMINKYGPSDLNQDNRNSEDDSIV